MLLKSGADANLPKEDGQTPLHLAAHNGNLKTLKLLLEDDSAKPLLQSKVCREIRMVARVEGYITVYEYEDSKSK